MTELKPCRMNAGMQELLDDIDIEREINKIKADAVREFLGEIKAAYKPPRLSPTKLEYYKAAIRHVLQAGEIYANKLEQGE